MDGDDVVIGHVIGPVVTYLLQMWINFIQVLLKFLTQQIYSKDLDASIHLYYIVEVKNLTLGHISVPVFRVDAVARKNHDSINLTDLSPVGAYYLSTFHLQIQSTKYCHIPRLFSPA